MFIIGKSASVDRVKESIEDNGVLSFNKIVPQPQELDITQPPQTEEEKKQTRLNIEKYGYPSGYDWRLHNWGTKWEPDVSLVTRTDKSISSLVYHFETAWSPPVEIAHRLSEINPDVLIVIAYDEPGMDFSGYAYYYDGLRVDGKQMESVSNLMAILGGDLEVEYVFDLYTKGEEE